MSVPTEISQWGALLAVLVFGFVGKWNDLKSRKRDAATKQAAEDAKQVAETAAKKLLESDARNTQKMSEIHTLVNSDMARQLRTVMIMSQRLAVASHDPEDIRVADQAKKDYDDHQVKQAVVDKSNET